MQFVVFLVVSDFLQWCVHRLLLHRVGFLWQFHKLHHSVKEMDWAANFRFHWMEVVVYKSLLYIPLFCWLGGSYGPLMSVYVFATVWGHFNHSNVHIGLGPLAVAIGTLQAAEAVRLVTGHGTLLTDRLLTLDAVGGRWRTVRLRRNRSCRA